MVEAAAASVGWSSSTTPKRMKRQRGSKVVTPGKQSRCSPSRNVIATSKTIVRTNAFDNLHARPADHHIHTRVDMRNSFEPENSSYRNTHRTSDEHLEYNPALHQNIQAGPPWQSSLLSYSLATQPPFFDRNEQLQSQNDLYLHVASNIGEPWNEVATTVGNINTEVRGTTAMEIPFGSYGSLDSLPGSTPTSPDSEGYVFPLMTTTFDSPAGLNQPCGLDISNEYFHIGQPFYPPLSCQQNTDPLYQDSFCFENDAVHVPVEVDFPSSYKIHDDRWSSETGSRGQPSYHDRSYNSHPDSGSETHLMWTSEQLPLSKFRIESEPRVLTVEPPIKEASDQGKKKLGPVQMKTEFICRETPATPPQADSDTESWIIQFEPKAFTPTHSSPRSLASVPSHTSSPKHIEPEPHGHVFRSFAGISKPKIAKGRQRNLTDLEKIQAREVREAKACWACHISKTKCSPCSPGTPCQQCARLVGKRRFCKFDCFNDPLESLYIFLVPDYIFEHFTRQNVEAFVARNTKSWGEKSFPVRISWGSRRTIQTEVVALELRSGRSEMAFENTTKAHGLGWKQNLVRQQSPPLGIPVAAMDDMQDAYNDYVQNIVQTDLLEYIDIGYFEQDSALAKRLLRVVCSFYTSSAETGPECEVLRQAIEIHVTAKILEKSLSLDPESSYDVQNRFQTRYPEKPVARCVQRQIKLAFFLNQQQRVNKVLKDWGALMWTIGNTAGNDNKWAVSFCVFLVLTLVMDKVSASAHYYCEDKILHQGSGPETEKAAFLQLIKLTETQLFDRCKEIFHWKFKTRKGGKEACNPIRDGMEAFRGRPVSNAIANLTYGLQGVVREFGKEVRSHTTMSRERLSSLGLSPYADTGRLAAIFLDDFLDH